MISGFIVKKGQMTSIFTQDGKRIAVTKCFALPLTVTQIKNEEKDGYSAIQTKTTFPKLNKIKEFNLITDQTPEVGSSISIDTVFAVGDNVDITGISKGRGFAGVIKRHGFKKQPILGSSDRVRHPGSIGAQTPSKVVRGKKMPGHMGNVNKTVENLKIISINPETNEILINGSIPGHFNSWITITKA